MKKGILAIFAASMVLVSCGEAEEEWSKEDEETFVGNCTSSYIKSFESSMGSNMVMVNEDRLHEIAGEYCSCAYESLKKNYDSPEEAFKNPMSELMEKAGDCEPTDEDIESLLNLE